MLSINQLHKELEKREDRKGRIYQKILEKCHYRIISTNAKSTDCYCFFVVPTVVFGVPLYNVTSCVVYIMRDLTARGFRVFYTNPNLLFINWIEKPKNIDIKPQNQYRLISDKPNNSLIYHPTDFKTLEYKADNLFNI